MSSYLEIAETVLRAVKRPMKAKSILKVAYQSEILPEHLYGKTQEKTLQARLSEDILRLKNHSRFYRTKPGCFFLTAFESDPSIPEEHKQHFSARRRTRDLYPDYVLAIEANFASSANIQMLQNWNEFVEAADANDATRYVDPKRESDNYLPVWTFSVVRRDRNILTYRIGRYRDDRDKFMNRRTIGFPSIIGIQDQTLFSEGDYGARESALDVVLTDLDISLYAFKENENIAQPEVVFVVPFTGDDGQSVILAVMEWSCPSWYEPSNHRLSLNDLSWMDVSVKPNDINDFEPWSIATMKVLYHR